MGRLTKKILKDKKKIHTSYDYSNSIERKSNINPSLEAFKVMIMYGLISLGFLFITDFILKTKVKVNDVSLYRKGHILTKWAFILSTMGVIYFLVKSRIVLLQQALNKIYNGYKELAVAYETNADFQEKLKTQFREIENQRNALIESSEKQNLMSKKLNFLAYYDSLTGLDNRYMFEKKVKKMIKSNKFSSFALAFIDVDNFKYINDTLGHASGDVLLKDIAAILKNSLNKGDWSARLSGDEFAIVFDNIETKEDVMSRVECLMKDLRKPWNLKGQEFFISFSMGIAMYPEHGEDLMTLLKKADTAMFNVKEMGRDDYCFYLDNMEEKTLTYINHLKQIRYAIENEEFDPYYQPQIDINTGKVIGLEVLARWIDPKRGLILPKDFIGFCKKTGYIKEIEKLVFKKVLHQKKIWDKQGFGDIKISMNMSGEALLMTNLLSYVKDTLKEYKVDCEAIEIEITETAIMKNLDLALKNINEIKELGIRISLDDFGTGYSSLNYLKKLPIDTVKIDKEFISSITSRHEEEVIVKTIIELVHGLNMKVCAEGIENKEQLEFLKKYQCDIGQGYLFSRAVPAEEVEKIFKNQYKL